MSVLIKGMKMPKDCHSCPFPKWIDDGCAGCVAGDKIHNASKPVDCPLIEVPEPHGDLIDRDALDTRVRQAGGMGNVEEECTEDFNDGVLFVLDYFVKNAPTVIPREDGKNHDD